jgi:hypothetical protein
MIGQETEVVNHACRNQHPKDRQKLPLREQIRFARFPNCIRNLRHAVMHGQIFRLNVLHKTEGRADKANEDANVHQRRARHSAKPGEFDSVQIRYVNICFTGFSSESKAQCNKGKD